MPAAIRYSSNLYVAIAVVAIAPMPCALIGDWVQHRFLPEPYWALPISVASFYTPLWWGLSVNWLARRVDVRHWAIRWSVVGAIVFAGARLLYWWPNSRDLEIGTVAALIDARLSGHAIGNRSVILLGITTYVCLSVATKQILLLPELRIKKRGSMVLGREREREANPRHSARDTSTISVVCVGIDGWVEAESSLLSERVTTARAFHLRWWDGVRLFHRDGNCYEVASAATEQHLSPLSELLANTFYNPRLVVRYEYRSSGAYELETLKRALMEAVDKDDDILTQFHESGEIKAQLNLARSFDDVVEVLHKTQA